MLALAPLSFVQTKHPVQVSLADLLALVVIGHSIDSLDFGHCIECSTATWTLSTFTSTTFRIATGPLGFEHFRMQLHSKGVLKVSKSSRLEPNCHSPGSEFTTSRWVVQTEAEHGRNQNNHSSGIDTSGKTRHGSAHPLPRCAGGPVTTHTVCERVVQGDHFAV